MTHIVTISGSPAANARATAILNYAQRLVKRRGVHSSSIIVRNLPAEDLLHAKVDSYALQEAQVLVSQADAVVIATPVYKGAYSGILKAFLDILPQNAFLGKRILPIAIGASQSQMLAIDYSLKPVLSALGATGIYQGIFVQHSQIQIEHGGLFRLDEEIDAQLVDALDEIVAGYWLEEVVGASTKSGVVAAA